MGRTTASDTFACQITRFYVTAAEDNTDFLKNNVKVGSTFSKGQSIDFDVIQGDVVTYDRQIQVDLIGADRGDSYELRWYAQVYSDDWSDGYLSPVAETSGNTGFWFYDPQSSTITINYFGGNLVGGAFTVPAKPSKFIPCLKVSTTAYTAPIIIKNPDTTGSAFYSGVCFKGRNSPFYGLVQVDASQLYSSY